jgi:hypothetical protein
MSWPFAKDINTAISPDEDGISSDMAEEIVYNLAFFSLGYEDIAEDIAVEVVHYLTRHWEHVQNNGGRTDPPAMGNKPNWNRAIELIYFTHDELEEPKKSWIDAYRAKTHDLDNQTMLAWYGEENIIYALDHNASYVATLPYVLFTYKSEDVTNLYGLIDSEKSLEKNYFSKRKENFHDHLIEGTAKHPKHWLGDFLRSKKPVRNAVQHFPEKRFVAQPVTDENFKLLVETLKRWTPPGSPLKVPEEVLSGTFNPEDLDLEELIKQQVNSSSPHAIERGRMRFLMYPPFLFGVLKAMGLDPPEEKLDIPDFDLKNPSGGQGNPPINRNNLPPLSQGRRAAIRKRLIDKRKMGRGPISRKTLVAEVRGENRLTIPLDEPKRAQMRLNPGEIIIKLKCLDRKGSHPLDVHFISWDETPDDTRPQKYVTALGDGRKVELNVYLKRDLTGNSTAALVDFDYTCETSRQDVTAWIGSMVAGFAMRTRLMTEALSVFWRERLVTYAASASLALLALILLARVVPTEETALHKTNAPNLNEVTPMVAYSDLSKRRRNIHLPKESQGDKDNYPRAGYENGLFLCAEEGYEITSPDEGDDKWHIAVKRSPGRTAAPMRDINVSLVDLATGEAVAVSKSEDGRVALPSLQAGTYEVTVNRRGVNFTRTVELPLDSGTYVELRKEATARSVNR